MANLINVLRSLKTICHQELSRIANSGQTGLRKRLCGQSYKRLTIIEDNLSSRTFKNCQFWSNWFQNKALRPIRAKRFIVFVPEVIEQHLVAADAGVGVVREQRRLVRRRRQVHLEVAFLTSSLYVN